MGPSAEFWHDYGFRDMKLTNDVELLCYVQFRLGRTEQLRPSYSSASIVRLVTSGGMSWQGQGVERGEGRNAPRMLRGET